MRVSMARIRLSFVVYGLELRGLGIWNSARSLHVLPPMHFTTATLLVHKHARVAGRSARYSRSRTRQQLWLGDSSIWIRAQAWNSTARSGVDSSNLRVRKHTQIPILDGGARLHDFCCCPIEDITSHGDRSLLGTSCYNVHMLCAYPSIFEF